MATARPAIEAVGLVKRYARAESAALDGFDLSVAAGSVCALLGPNGAGKTTAIRILATLLRLDAGQARVAGHDVVRAGHRVRERIGLVGQDAAVDEILTGRQNLVLFARLHGLDLTAARSRAEQLLAQFGLTEAADRSVSTYSGGMRRRLDLAAGLVVTPAVLFVDEPTTGLDPAGRRDVWASIRELVTGGVSCLLTTQYLEEADALADRVAILRSGRVVAEGTPAELKATVGDTRVEITVSSAVDAASVRSLAQRRDLAEIREYGSFVVDLPVAGPSALIQVCADLARAGIEPRDVALREPTLDDVFLSIHEAPMRTEDVHDRV
jgi:ABC-2 type transport system ATP-binding protein